MKHDLTTGTWQDDTGCPISFVLAATSDVDYNALSAGCCIISCCPLLLELTSSEPLTLDEEMRMQEEWHRDERKCNLVILARDLLLLDLDVVDNDRPSVFFMSPSRIPSP